MFAEKANEERKMKHKTLVFGFLGVLLLIVAQLVAAFFYNQYREQYKDNADFKNYATEFKTISEFLLKEYSDATEKWLGVSIEDVEGRGIYDSDINELIECPTEVKNALNTICDFGFPSETAIFEAIRICDGNVYFCITSGRYALVYAKEDIPSWYDTTVEDKDIHSSKIEAHWYHICITEE